MIRTNPVHVARRLLWILFSAMMFGQAASASAAQGSMRHVALLEQALPRYQQLSRTPELTQLPDLPGRTLHPGESWFGMPALRRLLAAVGDLPAREATNADLVLDDTLVAALKRFQDRHGMKPDGELGAATWRSLTTPMAERVRQIELTLARWRELTPNPYQRAIFVNIPQFRLYGVGGADDRETRMLQIDTVVGKNTKKTRTPIFYADLTQIVFRPYWEVPRSIVLGEILPRLRKERDYLEQENMELVDGSGNSVPFSAAALEGLQSGALRLRQRPGAGNALGDVKFMMPNEHDVYLHDTPQRHLFERSSRAFSHGCVRVEDPAALALWLLELDPAWTPDRIDAAMSGDAPLQVKLREPVRVYIVYATAVASEDGSVMFFDDIYGLDGQPDQVRTRPVSR